MIFCSTDVWPEVYGFWQSLMEGIKPNRISYCATIGSMGTGLHWQQAMTLERVDGSLRKGPILFSRLGVYIFLELYQLCKMRGWRKGKIFENLRDIWEHTIFICHITMWYQSNPLQSYYNYLSKMFLQGFAPTCADPGLCLWQALDSLNEMWQEAVMPVAFLHILAWHNLG